MSSQTVQQNGQTAQHNDQTVQNGHEAVNDPASSLCVNSQVKASKVQITEDKRFIILSIERSNGTKPAQNDQFKYPMIWLRDNCQCRECYNPIMKSRTQDWAKFNINCAPKQLTVSKL